MEYNNMMTDGNENDALKKFDEIEKDVTKQKSKKKKITNFVMFILNILIVVGILLYNIYSTDGYYPFSQTSINVEYLIITLLIAGLTMILDVFIIRNIIKKASRQFNFKLGLRSFGLSYRSFALLRYYDNITPMSIGGQPFMSFDLYKHGIPVSSSIITPLKKFIIQQISWLIITLVGLILSMTFNVVNQVPIYVIAGVGFILNSFLICFVLITSSRKKFSRKIVVMFLKFFYKIKIVKNYNKSLKKTLSFMADYYVAMQDFGRDKFNFFLQIFLNLIKNVVYFTLPFFIYCVFATPDYSMFLTFFIFATMVELASSCFPLPGGSGMNEITFSVLFSTYLENSVFWAMLLWRFVSYYYWLIQGLAIVIIDFIRDSRKSRKTI